MKNLWSWILDKARKLEESKDHLSCCHSLVYILRFLNYSDVLNCRLVNHRINDVIQKNQQTMPRRKADLLIRYFECDEPHALLHLTTNVKHFYMISAHRITIWKSRNPGIRQVDAHFFLYGVPIELDEISEDEMDTMKTANDVFGCQSDDVMCYRISSIVDGLGTVLRILFRLYYFNQMTFPLRELNEVFAKELLAVVVEEFKGSGSVCSKIVPSFISPGILEVVDATEIRRLSPFMGHTNIKEIFPKLPLNKIDELILMCEIDTFDEIIKLIRGMQSRSHRVSYVWLWSSRNLANFHDLFLTAIKSNFEVSFISKPSLFQLLFDKKVNAKKAIEIKRSINSKVIKVYFCGKVIHLS